MTIGLGLAMLTAVGLIVWSERDAWRPQPTLAGAASGNWGDDQTSLLLRARRRSEAVDEILGCLASDDARVREGAIVLLAALAAMGGSDRDLATPIRVKALDGSEEIGVRMVALKSGARLRIFRAPEDLVPLVRIARHSDSAAPGAFHGLGALEEPGLRALLELLDSDDSWVRHHAAIGLASMKHGATAALPALERRLEDADRGVRIQATAAIESIDPSFDLRGRGAWLGDANADADERELLRLSSLVDRADTERTEPAEPSQSPRERR